MVAAPAGWDKPTHVRRRRRGRPDTGRRASPARTSGLLFPRMPASNPARCASCGAALTGRFCAECGTPAAGLQCRSCQAELTSGARFCHRCGAPAHAGIARDKERAAWIVTAIVAVVTIAVVFLVVQRGRVPAATVPDMGNVGNVAAGGVQRAPDISRMTPRERFDRLFDRVVAAAERRQPDTVALFAPMAIGAYAQLDEIDQDARYHAAMIHLVVGETARARALADTIAAESPGHLFASVVRGEVAEAENDTRALARAYEAFLAAYESEMAAGRREYDEHRPVLEDFRTRALANRR